DQATTNHIYVGRNYSHDNKQTGFWAKQAVDVIFSQNESANHRPGNSSMGACMGYQYATDQIWFLFNRMHDCDYGIAIHSDSDLGTGTETYLIGNVIYNIHHSTADYQTDSGWGNAAIMLAGGIHRYVINNTIYDVDAGVNSPSTAGTLEIADNIISNVTAPAGNHIFIEMGSLADATNVHHDLLSGDPRLRWGGGPQTHPTATQLAGVQSIVFDPMFVDPLQANFHIPTNSPAAGTGELNPVYDVFLRRYGFSITVDADGRSRAGSATTDMGAYLAGNVSAQPSEGVPSPSTPEDPSPQSCQGTSAVPGAPTGLNIVRQPDSTVTIAWSAPQSCGAPTSYVVEVGTAPKLANVESQATDGAETSVVWPLLPGTYYVRVRGRNAAGTGQPSNVVQAGGVPGAPSGFGGQIDGATFNVSWTAPKTGGAPATYLLEAGSAPGRADVGSMIVGAGSTNVTAPVTRRGTFFLRVRAVSPVGTSAPSNEIRLTAR
ncbi:MAG: fibronectin type III domain-containing protein, partial [bacterium]